MSNNKIFNIKWLLENSLLSSSSWWWCNKFSAKRATKTRTKTMTTTMSTTGDQLCWAMVLAEWVPAEDTEAGCPASAMEVSADAWVMVHITDTTSKHEQRDLMWSFDCFEWRNRASLHSTCQGFLFPNILFTIIKNEIFTVTSCCCSYSCSQNSRRIYRGGESRRQKTHWLQMLQNAWRRTVRNQIQDLLFWRLQTWFLWRSKMHWTKDRNKRGCLSNFMQKCL